MYKQIAFLFLLLLLTGCSSAPKKATGEIVYVPADLTMSSTRTAEVLTACPDACVSAIERFFDIESAWIGGPFIMALILERLDGARGPHSPVCLDCSGPIPQKIFNDPWGYNYRVRVPDGKHKARVSVQYAGARKPRAEEIEFVTLAGRSCFLGQVLVTIGAATQSGYKWHPVVVHLQTNAIIYPKTLSWRER